MNTTFSRLSCLLLFGLFLHWGSAPAQSPIDTSSLPKREINQEILKGITPGVSSDTLIIRGSAAGGGMDWSRIPLLDYKLNFEKHVIRCYRPHTINQNGEVEMRMHWAPFSIHAYRKSDQQIPIFSHSGHTQITVLYFFRDEVACLFMDDQLIFKRPLHSPHRIKFDRSFGFPLGANVRGIFFFESNHYNSGWIRMVKWEEIPVYKRGKVQETETHNPSGKKVKYRSAITPELDFDQVGKRIIPIGNSAFSSYPQGRDFRSNFSWDEDYFCTVHSDSIFCYAFKSGKTSAFKVPRKDKEKVSAEARMIGFLEAGVLLERGDEYFYFDPARGSIRATNLPMPPNREEGGIPDSLQILHRTAFRWVVQSRKNRVISSLPAPGPGEQPDWTRMEALPGMPKKRMSNFLAYPNYWLRTPTETLFIHHGDTIVIFDHRSGRSRKVIHYTAKHSYFDQFIGYEEGLIIAKCQKGIFLIDPKDSSSVRLRHRRRTSRKAGKKWSGPKGYDPGI